MWFRWCVSTSVAALVLLTAVPAFAQAERVVRTVSLLRLGPDDAVRLDGVLDEPVWQRSLAASDFRQREPANGEPATERTEVRLLRDASRLILGVMLYDSEPGRVLGNQMQRDQSFDADDRFLWTLDTFMNGRTGYFFEINPSGAMGDGLIDPGVDPGSGNEFGVGVNRSWDGIWLARVRRTAEGWSAEVEIPLRTINFDPNTDVWGMNFQRTIRRKNEETLWMGDALNQGLTRMTHAGHLQGVGGLSQGVGLDLKPYVVGAMASAPGRGQVGTGASGTVGGDVFYSLTPALRANVSINTDFAETEVDDRRVNLTRFPLFFEEKRDFFLEGSSFFGFSREPDEAVVPFFSRRIGLDEEGAPQRIDIGTKLTGQAGAFDVGVLQVRTGESAGRIGEDFSVLRLRRRAFAQSYVGGLYTRRSARTAGDIDRHTVGLDFALETSRFRGNKNLALSGFSLWTSNPLATGESAGYGVRASYPNDPFTFEVAARELQANYDPALGFVERRGYKRLNSLGEWAPRLRNSPWVRGFEFSFDFEALNDTANRPLARELDVTPFEVNFNDGSRIALDVTRQYERLDEDFEISDGIVLPTGRTYRFTRYEIGGSTGNQRVISLGADYAFGPFFSGDRRELTLEFSARPRRGVSIAVEAERNVLELAEGSFTTSVYRVVGSTQFNPWVSLVNNLQYDTVSGGVGWQMRFRWIRRPGNDVYVVYTRNWREGLETGARRLTTIDSRLASKIVYTLRF